MYIPHSQTLAEYSLLSQNLHESAQNGGVDSAVVSYPGAPNLPPGYDFDPPTGLDFIPLLVKVTWGLWFLIVACMICRGVYEKLYHSDDDTVSDSASSIAGSTWRIEDSSYPITTTTTTTNTTHGTMDDIIASKHKKRLKKLEQLAPTQSLQHWRAEKQSHHIENFATVSTKLSCAICLDFLEEADQIRELSCGHVYHAKCLNLWVERGHHDCPLCKYDILKLRQQEEEERRQEGEQQAEQQPQQGVAPGVGGVGLGGGGGGDVVINIPTISIPPEAGLVQVQRGVEVGQPSSHDVSEGVMTDDTDDDFYDDDSDD